VQDLDAGDTVDDTTTFTATDGTTQQVAVTITGTNDAPEVTAPGAVNNTEDELETGITVTAVTSNLLDNAADVDDEDTTLVIGEVNGQSGNVGSAVGVTLAFTDVDGNVRQQSVDLTVNQSGSYELSQVDWDELPFGTDAKGTFTYRVADGNGGLSSEQTAPITITGTNDAPTLDESKSPQLVGIDEDISGSVNSGTRVDTLIASGSIDDPDGPSDASIYVTAVDETNGSWQFLTDSGESWTAIDFSGGNAGKGLLLDASDQIRFMPDNHYNGQATIDFGAWDETSGDAGTYADVTERGAGTAFSSQTDTASIEISPVNDAPIASGDASLAEVQEDTEDPNGEFVGRLFAESFDDSRDGDLADDLAGIAVTGNAADGTEGNWQYNVGGNWQTIGTSVSDASALILDGFASLRFVPATDFNGAAPALTVRLIEDDFTGYVSGGTADVSGDNNGGTTEVSDQTIALGTKITSVNDEPEVSGPIAKTVDEDASLLTVDLLRGATDADASDTLSVTNLAYQVDNEDTTDGDVTLPAGVSLSGSDLKVDPAGATFQELAAGETQIIEVSYDISDGNGGSVEQTATITINGINDAPEITYTPEDATHTESENSTPINIANDDFAIDTVEPADKISELTLTVANVTNDGEILNIDGSAIDLLTPVVDGSSDNYTYDVIYEPESNVSTVTLKNLSLADSDAETLVQSITYENTSGAPIEGDRVVSITVVDSGGNVGAGDDTATAKLNTIQVEAIFSGLDIGAAAGPFLDGKLAISAVDGSGNELFTYDGSAVGDSIGDGVTLIGVETEALAGQSVITNLKVEFDDFSGAAFLQVDPGTSKYIDEALGEETSLDIPLRGSAEVPTEGFGEISLTPFTELAIKLVEEATQKTITLEDATEGELTELRNSLDTAADRVFDLTGVDIRDTRPVAVNQASFESSADLDANQYGLKLAALSEYAGDDNTSNRVQSAIDRLIKDVSPAADSDENTIVFQNGGAELRNKNEFTDSLDAFVVDNATVRDRVIDADRPETPPTIGEFLVIDDVPVIEGEAQFFDRGNTAGEDSDLSLQIALGDSTVFSADPADGSGGGPLEITDAGDADNAGTWQLTLSDLDPGAYRLDVYVVDEAANTTLAEGRDEDNAPIIQLLGDGLASPDTDDDLSPDATLVRRTLTEGDDAAAVSTTGRLAIGDLDADETVSVRNSELIESAGDTSVLGVADSNLAGYFDLPFGQVLNADQQIAFSDWAFSGDAAVFDRLTVGESVTLTYDFSVKDSDGRASNDARLEITIEGANDAPVVTDEITAEVETGDKTETLDLLAGATDVDVSDTLSIANVTFAVDGSATANGGAELPVGVTLSGSDLTVDPSDPAFQGLTPGDTRTILASYDVTDGNGGLVAQTATIIITGEPPNEPPSGSDKTVEADEDATYTIQASDFGFSDSPDSDTFDGGGGDCLAAGCG